MPNNSLVNQSGFLAMKNRLRYLDEDDARKAREARAIIEAAKKAASQEQKK
jgi:hypothetical protein